MGKNKMTTKTKLEITVLSVFALFGITMLYQVRNLPQTAAMFPRYISTLLLVLCGVMFVGRIMRSNVNRAEVPKEVKPVEAAADDSVPWPQTMFLIIVYFLCIFVLGFMVSSAVLSFTWPLISRGFNKKNIIQGAVFTVILLVLLVLFSKSFYVVFPTGLVTSAMGLPF